MKITIEPTTEEYTTGKYNCPKVSIEIPSDELNATEAINLCANALIAFGFSSDLIREILPEE